MAAPKVYLNIGHGGTDPGAVANDFKEKDLNLAIGLACQKELVRHGVTVLMSRTKDEDDPLKDVIAECNAFNPALAASLHNNAGGGDGAEVYHSIVGGTGKTLATNINEAIKATGQNSRGVKTRKNENGKDYYGFIRQTKAPAVIVEYAFVDNKTDLAIIDTAAEQAAMGVATAKGILKTLGIAWQPEKQPVQLEAGNTLYTVCLGFETSKKDEAVAQLEKAVAAGFKNATLVSTTKAALKA